MTNHTTKDRSKNQYQIGIIISIVAMLLYGYALYNAVRMHKTNSIYINGGIMVAWFLLALYWLRQLGIHNKKKYLEQQKQEKEQESSQD